MIDSRFYFTIFLPVKLPNVSYLESCHQSRQSMAPHSTAMRVWAIYLSVTRNQDIASTTEDLSEVFLFFWVHRHDILNLRRVIVIGDRNSNLLI